jgi:hypothetical protein
VDILKDLSERLDKVEELYRKAEIRYRKTPNYINDVRRHSLFKMYHSVCIVIDGLREKRGE